MRIEGFDPGAEPGKVQTFYEMYAAGIPFDDPDGPPWTPSLFMSWVANGWAGERRKTALAVGDDGAPVGACLVELPDRRNKHIGNVTLLVPPGQRRHGTGRAMLRHLAQCAAADGRTLLTADARCGSPAAAFAADVGARAGLIGIRRVLELADLPSGYLAGLRGQAEAAARGYSLAYWAGPAPEQYLEGMALVATAMDDAPHNAGREPHRPDTEWIREAERRSAERGNRSYSVVAVSDQTGEVAAMTQLVVDSADPVWAYQMVTAVARPHRGHRLGMLVKVDMLERLAEPEPKVRRIMTGNAGANRFMIAINAELGFKVLDEWQTWDLDVTDAVALA
ncbi:MAG TPA: GNAT family N-acetyltransferase [Streptosporangiaceae bacterium]|jgi:GNAT superfamily N-acetyltransferase|nr:GNAT family N-acetyltransferase [Streptosporangiaceae bacterium]